MKESSPLSKAVSKSDELPQTKKVAEVIRIGERVDYLGNKFVYDSYNQDPDSVEPNKFGYKVFFTRDRDLIDEFAEMRTGAYLEEFAKGDMIAFGKTQESFDRKGKILVVVKNGALIGGMRLMFSDDCKYLSNEYPGTQFEYRHVLRRYGENEASRIVEVAGVVVKKGLRDFSATESMFEFVIKVALINKCSYIFGTALITACRLYRIIFDKFDRYLEIVLSHPWERKEIFGFAKMFPIYVKLSK
jgi:hypothetical protein